MRLMYDFIEQQRSVVPALLENQGIRRRLTPKTPNRLALATMSEENKLIQEGEKKEGGFRKKKKTHKKKKNKKSKTRKKR